MGGTDPRIRPSCSGAFTPLMLVAEIVCCATADSHIPCTSGAFKPDRRAAAYDV